MVPPAAAAECPGADVPATDAVAAKSATLCLVNSERAAVGAPPVTVDPALGASAQAYAERMVAERFFSHVDPSGATFFDRLRSSGYADASFSVGGENLGWLGGAATPRGMVAAWLGSAPHRANMLDPRFRDTGVGVAGGTPTGVAGFTFAQEFGARTAASSVSSSSGQKQGAKPKQGGNARGKKSRPKGKKHRHVSRHGSARRSHAR